MPILNTKTKEVEIRDVAAKDNPIVQAQVKPFADADNVFEVFLYTDSVVRYLWGKINHLQKLNDSDESQA